VASRRAASFSSWSFFKHSGSFKAAGAFAISWPQGARGRRGGGSGGNHGAAVAYASMKLKVPQRSSFQRFSAKIARIREYGPICLEAIAMPTRSPPARRGRSNQGQCGACVRSGRDHAGTGDHRLELDQQAGFDTLLVSVGGAGLM